MLCLANNVSYVVFRDWIQFLMCEQQVHYLLRHLTSSVFVCLVLSCILFFFLKNFIVCLFQIQPLFPPFKCFYSSSLFSSSAACALCLQHSGPLRANWVCVGGRISTGARAESRDKENGLSLPFQPSADCRFLANVGTTWSQFEIWGGLICSGLEQLVTLPIHITVSYRLVTDGNWCSATEHYFWIFYLAHLLSWYLKLREQSVC